MTTFPAQLNQNNGITVPKDVREEGEDLSPGDYVIVEIRDLPTD